MVGRMLSLVLKQHTQRTGDGNVVSHGVCGETEDVGFALENDLIIAFCPPDRIEQLIDEIRSVLNKFGGACYVSEVQEVDTVSCIVRR